MVELDDDVPDDDVGLVDDAPDEDVGLDDGPDGMKGRQGWLRTTVRVVVTK